MAEEIEKTAEEYFAYVKSKEETLTNEYLKTCLANMSALATKYQKTKQVRSLKKLKFLTEVLIQEEQLLNIGINKYIYRQDIEEYLDKVAKNTVKIIELGNYVREIPDEAVEVIEKTDGIFDKYYIIYTDYTGREERRVEEEKKSRDPILFGVFEHNAFVADRFYVLADWVDEYCDLTLDKMVAEMKEAKPCLNLVQSESIPQTSEELLTTLKSLEPSKTDDSFYVASNIANSDIVIREGQSVEQNQSSNEEKKKETSTMFQKFRKFFSNGGFK